MPSISEFIEEYRQQLNEIEELSSHIRELQQEANFYWNGKLDYSTIPNKIRENDKFLSAKILEVLQLRDSIQTQLSDRYESSKELVELVELDDRLKQQAESEGWINRIESLRKSFNPKAELKHWWWFEDLDWIIKKYRQQLKELKDLSSQIRDLRLKATLYWDSEPSYATIVQQIKEKKKVINEKILAVLKLRDSIQTRLSDQHQSSKELVELVQLDTDLKQQVESEDWADRIESLRKSFNPKAESEYWWWFEQKPSLKKCGWILKVGTNTLWIIALALLINFSSKIIAGNPDVIGTSAVLLNTLLTLLIGRGILWGASGWIENGMEHLGFPKRYEKYVQLFLAVVVLLFAWGLHQDLPNLSEIYYNRAEDFYIVESDTKRYEAEHNSWRTNFYKFWVDRSSRRVNDQKSQFSLALADYTRATKFDPENWRAYNRLGEIYEDLQDMEQAVTQYRVAAKGELIEGLINLSRYYILKYDPEIKKEEAQQSNLTAIGFLTRANTKIPNPNSLQAEDPILTETIWNKYQLYTYQSWAYLNLAKTEIVTSKTYLKRARDVLKNALVFENEQTEIISDNSIAHCVLAEILEEDGPESKEIIIEGTRYIPEDEWDSCKSALNSPNNFLRPYEAAWHTKSIDKKQKYSQERGVEH